MVRLVPGHDCMELTEPKAGMAVMSWWEPTYVNPHAGKVQSMRGKAPTGMRSAELRVPANVPTTVVLDYLPGEAMGRANICRITRSFVPRAGQQLQMLAYGVFGWPSRCVVELTDIDTGLPVPTAPADPSCQAHSPDPAASSPTTGS